MIIIQFFGFTDLDLIINNKEWLLNKAIDKPNLTVNRSSNEFYIKKSFIQKMVIKI